jgi:Xaa-Pro aminopeptidase
MHFEHYMPWMKDIRVMHGIGRAEEVAAVFRDYRLKSVGFDQLGFEDHQGLQRAAKGVGLVGVGGKIADERAVKFEEELVIMRQSAKVTEASIRGALKSAKAGMREYEIAAEGEYAARKRGAEGMSWGLATFSGLNTSLMLRHDSEKIVRNGELLIMGYATIYKGYNTDITITTVIGKPSKRQKEIYTATYDSYLAALKATKPGATTLEVHDAAEKVIVERGYGKYSFSRIQPILHGVGMNVYEPPFSPEPGKKEPSVKLRPGHVLAIEPAITLYDDLKVGGCRIGETLVVTDNGYQVMTDGRPATHDLLYES